jgi:hypothetical protein
MKSVHEELTIDGNGTRNCTQCKMNLDAGSPNLRLLDDNEYEAAASDIYW